MDIDLLKTFLEVHRTRHFGHAAENLFLSQSAVSARIRLLEETIGVPLFTRTRNNIQLTPAGQRLVRYAENILHAWNRARQEIAVEDETGVALAVGGVPSLWDIMLQGWLHRLRRELPDLVLQAEVHGTEPLLRRLLDGSLDLAFLFEAPALERLVVRQVARVPLILVSSRPRLEAQAALGEDYVLVDWGSSFANAHARHFPDMPAPKLRVGLGRIAHAYLLERGGAAYLAEPAVQAQLAAGTLHRVQDAPVIERLAYAVFAEETEKKAVVEQALACL